MHVQGLINTKRITVR